MAEEVKDAPATLRDEYAGAFDELEQATPAPAATPAPTDQPAPSAAKPAEGAAVEPTGERQRGPDGKFLPKSEATPAAAPAIVAPVAAPTKPRPSSWKKDYESDWAALTPRQQDYILQREGEFARGVSIYKQEWDSARPLLEAIQPFMPTLQQHGIDPAHWVSQLGNAHRSLAMGSPQEKMGTVQQILTNNGIPARLAIQDQQGNWQLLGQMPAPQPHQAPQRQAPDVESIIESKLIARDAQQSLAAFERDAPTKYQHYETVKETMARLLEAGFARDYPDAYERALRQPEHSEIFDAMQEQQRAAKDADRKRLAAEEAARARRQSVSPRSATPASRAAPKGDKKDLRSSYENAFDEQVEGRV